jgi:predicted  nucleic acid-binding Zn-ribbon protein
LKDESHHEDMTALRKDLDTARKRIVDLIKEKTDLENEMANF